MIDMTITPSHGCCGMYEISSLNPTPVETLSLFIQQYRNVHANNGLLATAIFTDSVIRGRGTNLAAYILLHGLGHITESPIVYNPKSGNEMRIWIWLIDWAALDNNHEIVNMPPVRRTILNPGAFQ